MNNKTKGNLGEKLAEKFLENKGYLILESQYFTPYGEVDIIAKDKDTIVFVEVKYRKTRKMGYPLEAINIKKQTKIINSSNYYMMEKNINCNMRFDAIGILDRDVVHIENAFLSQ